MIVSWYSYILDADLTHAILQISLYSVLIQREAFIFAYILKYRLFLRNEKYKVTCFERVK
jgi:hypothetical protein